MYKKLDGISGAISAFAQKVTSLISYILICQDTLLLYFQDTLKLTALAMFAHCTLEFDFAHT